MKTQVGNKVLIGSNSTILPIKIDDKVVIGAGSVVTQNCKKNKIYLGNPAKLKKMAWLRYKTHNFCLLEIGLH